MINHNRRKKLLKLLSQHQYLPTRDLPHMLDTSLPSARRDIIWLADRKLVRRMHGGVAALDYRPDPAAGTLEVFQRSVQQQTRQKRAIARAAAGMCLHGEEIVISGGTTTLLMAGFLREQQLNILTNSFQLAKEMLAAGDSDIILQGGTVSRAKNMILSVFEQSFSAYHEGAKTFVGVHGINGMGLIESNALVAESQRKFIERAGQLIVLADSSKFHGTGGVPLCPLARVSTVITDAAAPTAAIRMLESHGVDVILVSTCSPDSDSSGGRSRNIRLGA